MKKQKRPNVSAFVFGGTVSYINALRNKYLTMRTSWGPQFQCPPMNRLFQLKSHRHWCRLSYYRHRKR
jgi:hypothetical protein